MDADYASLLAKKTPQRSAAKSSFIQKCISFGSTKKGLSFEDSTIDGIIQSRDMSISMLSQGNDYNSVSGIYELDSKRLEVSSVMKDDFSSFSKGDFTNLSKGDFEKSVFPDGDTGTQCVESLCEEFLEFFLSYSGEHEIFNLLLNYENLCCNGVETLSKAYTKIPMTDKLSSRINMLFLLQQERNTWRLLRILFQDRLEVETVDEGELLLASMGKVSDKQIVDNLYQRDAYIRQNQLIVDWLEKNADEDFQYTYFDKFGFFTDECFALEHSMNELLTTNFNQNTRDKFCIEMDPDSRFRLEHDILHETDKENEDRLFKFMFIYIRAGKLDAAQQMAEKFGQPWIAAALEGWRLHHDPNYENQVMDGQELLPVEGNKYRDLWKSACWIASEQAFVPIYEQALYGSLCGNLKAVLSVCKTWEDYLWAYTKTSLDKLIEQEIRSCTQQERSLEELPVEYWDKIYNSEAIFQELEAGNNEVKQDCKIPYHIIQKYIILDDLGGLIEEMFSWLNNRNLDIHVLRLMAHIILFLRVIGRSTKEELCVPILEAYVQELIKSRKVTLVAPYTSTLPKEQQIMWYAKFLEGITDNNERQKCLQYAEDAGLDVSKITQTVVKNIREKGPIKIEPDTDLSAVTTEEDLQKIHAIDWLIFNPNQRAEAVQQANALMRIFVAQRKLEAAKLLFAKIPEDSVAVMMQLSKAKGYEELSANDDNATREYLCFKAYLEAMDAFNAWFHHFVHAKPKVPLGPSGDHVTFKEKVAHEHEMQQYEKDLKRWQHVVNMLGSTASECLYNVLLFVNGGWMVDQRTDGTVDEIRTQQLAHLRKICIPHVAHLLQDLLMTEKRYKEAIQMSDIISSERYQLYKEFTNEDIKQLLKVAVGSSLALLDANMDSLGYSN